MSVPARAVFSCIIPLALLALTACDAWFTNAPDSKGPGSKATLAGCWHEVGNPALETLGILYPLTDLHCVDLCFSLVTDRFEQVVYTPETVTYKKRYDLFGIKWTETHTGKSIEAYGKYTLAKDTLNRDFSYPDPPANDTAEIWRAKTAIAFNFTGDTLLVAGHRYIRPDESRHCGTLWKTFDPDPDPPKGGGGGGGDWD